MSTPVRATPSIATPNADGSYTVLTVAQAQHLVNFHIVVPSVLPASFLLQGVNLAPSVPMRRSGTPTPTRWIVLFYGTSMKQPAASAFQITEMQTNVANEWPPNATPVALTLGGKQVTQVALTRAIVYTWSSRSIAFSVNVDPRLSIPTSEIKRMIASIPDETR